MNVFPNPFEGMVVTNNMVMKTWLPLKIWQIAPAIDFVGAFALEPPDNFSQGLLAHRIGVLRCATSPHCRDAIYRVSNWPRVSRPRFIQRHNPVNMIGHNHVLAYLNIWKLCR